LEITVDTTSVVIDGATGTVSALIADPGPDERISLNEALRAVNNEYAAHGTFGHTIKFSASLAHGATIGVPYPTYSELYYVLRAPSTTIDGDIDGDDEPDILIRGLDLYYTLVIVGENNTIKNLALASVGIIGPNASGNTIQGCYVGLGADGVTDATTGDTAGIEIGVGAHHNLVVDNVIAGNTFASADKYGAGIVLFKGAHDNRVEDNWIGVDINHRPLRNEIGVLIAQGAYRNTIGGDRAGTACAAPCNLISGNQTGVWMLDSGTVSNTVLGNYVGVNLAGTAAISNTDWGIVISGGASGNIVGGDRPGTACAGPCNLVSGNGEFGIVIEDAGTSSNVVEGNYVGLNIGGTASIPHRYSGIVIQDGASGNTIGGERDESICDSWCNVISGNGEAGVLVYDNGTTHNRVQGNYIGVNPDGTGAVSNTLVGVALYAGASRNLVGGMGYDTTCKGPCNLISGNGGDGVFIALTNTVENLVQGNYIGLNRTGEDEIPNGEAGVSIFGGAARNTVGGRRLSEVCTGPCNIVSGNRGMGVGIFGAASEHNVVQGNQIGLGTEIDVCLGNQEEGVYIYAASNTIVGGNRPDEGNWIACNGEEGIQVVRGEATEPTNGNLLRYNRIWDNTLLPVDLVPLMGVGVGRDGPNNRRHPPALQPVQYVDGAPRLVGTTDAPASSWVDLYGGGGAHYITSTVVRDGAFSVTLGVADVVIEPVLAMVTDLTGNSSEFSGIGALYLDTPNALPGGRVYAFGVITDIVSGRPITTATGITITIGEGDDEADFRLRGDGQGADFFRDIYFSGWFTAPTKVGDYQVEIAWNDVTAATAALKVIQNPQVIVLTDLDALKNQFVRTSSVTESRTVYLALQRLARYAGDHRGVVIDARQSITLTNPSNPFPYATYTYARDTVHRTNMGIAIDNYIQTLSPYSRTLKYLAIIGDDAVIPSVRRSDPLDARCHLQDALCERKYPADMGGAQGSPTLLDSGARLILTDVPYASFSARDPNDVLRPVADMAVGRLFHATPRGLAQLIQAYETPLNVTAVNQVAVGFHQENDKVFWRQCFNGAIVPNVVPPFTLTDIPEGTTLLPGYLELGHFYRFNGFTSGWTGASVLEAVRNAALVVLYSHADQLKNTTEGNKFLAEDLADEPVQPGTLFINAGCHSGYPAVSQPPAPAVNHYHGTFSTVFLDRQIAYLAPTVYGFGYNYGVEHHDRLFASFLSRVRNAAVCSVGDAFRQAQVLFNDQVQVAWSTYDTYTRYGIALYGLPTQRLAGRCLAPAGGARAEAALEAPAATSGSEAGSAAQTVAIGAATTVHTIDVVVETPHFSVITDADGALRFELRNTGESGGAAHYPILPEVVRAYLLPAGADVTGITLVGQDSHPHPGTATLETVIPVNRTSGPQPGREILTGTYPAQVYWYGTADLDHSVLLLVGVNPLQYDPTTQQVTLYSRVALSVAYEAPSGGTTVTEMVVNGGAPVDVGMGQLLVQVTLSHAAAPQAMLLDWQVSGVNGMPIRNGREEVYLTTGATTVSFTTDTVGWPPGPALLSVTIGDEEAALHAGAMLLSAHGRSVAASTDQSYYNTELTATVSVEVYDETGAGVADLASMLTATLNSAPVALEWNQVGTGRYQAGLPLTGVSEGYHTLLVGLAGSASGEAGFGIDHTPPTATLQAPPAGTAGLAIPIRWSGSDEGSGVDYYEIQYAVNSPPWTDWFTASAELDYLPAHSKALFGPWAPVQTAYTTTYCFRIRAVDQVGNVGTYPGGSGNGCTGTFVNPPVDRAEAVPRVIELTNQARAAHGLPPLKMSSLLNESAQVQTDDMATNSFHDHIGSDGSTPGDRIYRTGYDAVATGENVACGDPTPEQVVAGWMDSPGHRANILNPAFREIGVGYTFDPVSVVLTDNCGYHFWGQNFGARGNVFPIVINGEAQVTMSPVVALTIYGAGWAGDMLVSNNADFAGASWQPFASTLSWTLAPAGGEGLRTVHVRLRNTMGETLDAWDDIILGCCPASGADMGLLKTDLPDPVMAGEPLTYTLSIANGGPVGTEGVMLFDTLPTGLEYQGYETTQGSCAYAGGTLSCDLGTMENGALVPVTLYTRVAAAAAGSLTNIARVTSFESDPNPANNSATSVTSVRGGRADLAVTKSDSADPVGIGATFTYAIVVSNAGPAAALGVGLTDTLPLSVDAGHIVPGQGSCERVGNLLNCILGTIPAGRAVTLTVAVTTTSAGMLSNTAVAFLTGDQLDPDPADNTAVEQTRVTNQFTVNSTGDAADSNPGDNICQTSGSVCTLRAAIQEANAQPGLDIVVFDIPGPGPHAIQPASALPTVSDPVVIDGSTEPDFAGTPVIELDGRYAGLGADGLTITAGGSTLRGLAINRFGSDGLFLVTGGGNVVEGCFVGTDPGGALDLGNGESGIRIYQSGSNTIGGSTAAARNLIAGNGIRGVWIDGTNSTGNLIQGNYIGTDITGGAAIANPTGIFITDATNNTVRSNLISGNATGVYLQGRAGYPTSGNIIAANTIGTDAAGSAALGNSTHGVYLDSTSYNTIGGALPVDGNLISGNGGAGIYVAGVTSFGHVIRHNRIGTNAAGSAALGNSSSGVRIGTDDGTFWQAGGWQHVIADNLISGNVGVGILLTASECQIENNRIGTDATGTLDLGNVGAGLRVSSASDNTIQANLISGNGGHGVFIDVFSLAATANLIRGNRVGTNAAGTTALGNDGIGIYLRYASGNQIGGTGAGEGNLVSGNGVGGIGLGATHDNVVQGNRVGTNAAGTAALGNISVGIGVSDFCRDNLIGGADSGAGNLVSGNIGDGVGIAGQTTRVEGNWIGTDATGTGPLGNSGNGVKIYSGMGSYNTIGGMANGAGNVIAFNGSSGVLISVGAARNAILSNRIYANAGLGIDLGGDGVTPNDPDDSDTGENALLNYPVLAFAAPGDGDLVVAGTLNSTSNAGFTLQFFAGPECDPSGYGEGQDHHGSLEATTDGSGHAGFRVTLPVALPAGYSVSATATDANGNTSEFAACALVTPQTDLSLGKSDSPDPVNSGQPLIYTLVVTNAGPSPATGVRLTDTLPAGLALAGASATQGACGSASPLTCTLGSLAPGATATVTLAVTPTASGVWANTATVTGNEIDPDLANNSAAECTVVDPADLALVKTAAPAAAGVGIPLTFTLVVANHGPLPATGVVATDTLPASFTLGAVTPSQGSCDGAGTVTCALGSLAPGGAATITLAVTPTVPGFFTNTARVSAAQGDPDVGNNTASVVTPVDLADLAVVKTGAPNPVAVGQPISYTIVITNRGPSTATGVVLTDTLPPGSVTIPTKTEGFDSGLVPPPGWTERVQNTDHNWSDFAYPGWGTTAIVTYGSNQNEWLLSPYLEAVSGGMTTTVWSMGHVGLCRYPSDNCDLNVWLVAGDVGGGDDVLLGRLDDDWPLNWTWTHRTLTLPSALPAGDLRIGYQYVGHNGADALIDLIVLPGEPAASAKVSPSQGSCVLGDVVTCSLGTMNAGATATVTLVLRPPATGILTNTVTVTSDQPDPLPANNTFTHRAAVGDQADLAVTKVDTPDPTGVGYPLVYTVTVTNHGLLDATGVVLTDTLPGSVILSAATPSQGACGGTAAVVCTLGALASGSQASVTLVVTPTAIGSLLNTVTVSGDQPDRVTANNSATQSTSVVSRADLAVTLSESEDPVWGGGMLTYTVVVANGGPDTATGVRLVDTLPGEALYDSAAPSHGGCIHDQGVLTCTLGTLNSGAVATVTLVVWTPVLTSTLVNTAVVASGDYDPVSSNNVAVQTTQVRSNAIFYEDFGGGIPITWTVINGGSGADTWMTDNPYGRTAPPPFREPWAMVDSSWAGPAATQDEQLITPDIDATGCGELRLVFSNRFARWYDEIADVDVSVDGGSYWTNVLRMQGAHDGPNTKDIDISAIAAGKSMRVRFHYHEADYDYWWMVDNVRVLCSGAGGPGVDLAVAKTDSHDPAYVGSPLTYTVEIANLGPSAATQVTLTDTLPTWMVLISAIPSQGTCDESGRVVSCALGSLTGDAATVTIVVMPTAAGTMTNTVTVAASENDANPANNSASESTLVLPVADLAVAKSGSPNPAHVGSPLTYTVVVANLGPSAATRVTLADTLPTGVVLISAMPSQGSCGESGGLVTCGLGSLAGDAATVTIVVMPTAVGTMTNTVTVAASEHDPNLANNSDLESISVLPVADLAVAKSGAPDPAHVGSPLTYTVVVANLGPSVATQVMLVDTLPADVLFASAIPNQGTCGETGGVVTCALGSLAGDAATVTIVVMPTATCTLNNMAAVAAGEHDPNLANNSASESTSVLPVADLAVAKSGAPNPAHVGSPLTYTVVVVNLGPSVATQVTLTDTLPAGAVFGTTSSSQGTCTRQDGLVTCSLGALPQAASATVTMSVTPTAMATLVNQARVVAYEHDPDPDNNLASAETVVGGRLAFEASFAGGIPDGWTVVNGGVGLGATATWTVTNACRRALPAGGWVMVDSDCAGMGEDQDEQLISPLIDVTDCGGVELRFANQFRYYGAETADVDVSTDDGVTWNNVLRMQGSDVGYPAPETRSLNIAALAAGQAIRVRFHYYNAHYAWWWAIGDVEVTCTASLEEPYRYIYLPIVLRH